MPEYNKLSPEVPTPENLAREFIEMKLEEFKDIPLDEEDFYRLKDKDGKPFLADGETLEQKVQEILGLNVSFQQESWESFVDVLPLPDKYRQQYKELGPFFRFDQQDELLIRQKEMFPKNFEARMRLDELNQDAITSIMGFNRELMKASMDQSNYTSKFDGAYFDPFELGKMEGIDVIAHPSSGYRNLERVYTLTLSEEIFNQLKDRGVVPRSKEVGSMIRVTSPHENHALTGKLLTKPEYKDLLKILLAIRLSKTQIRPMNEMNAWFQNVADYKAQEMRAKKRNQSSE